MKELKLERILKDYDKKRQCTNRGKLSGGFWCNVNNHNCDYLGNAKINTSSDWTEYKRSCEYWNYYEQAMIQKSKER